MGKKHRRRQYKPQKRSNQKPTVGQREFINVVYMEKETIDDRKNVYAVCTCGNWRSSPEATTFGKIGKEAREHVLASEGKCQLRQHDPYEKHPLDPLSEEAVL